ncbi:cupin domain-containing protein [Gulosibacter hominis]|uniref:cupin domain-containing protein n=1 Tax=Gulosibacter hominis TaxID=2770504 RepID=UPI0019195DE2|nr:cupin domain-containing protein [Gulosibacter hominis]
MTSLKPGVVIDALALDVAHETVPAEHDPQDGTTAGATELGDFAGLETGVWEMSRGVMHDTEADELCVIIAGEATVEFLEPQLPAVQLRAGSVLQLSEGMQTRWTVHSEQLRKVYLAP